MYKNHPLTKISVTYIEQSPQWFYGAYLYNGIDSGHFDKLDRESANIVLKTLTQNIPEIKDLELPRKLTSKSEKTLNLIKENLNKHKPGIFDWDDIMDIS